MNISEHAEEVRIRLLEVSECTREADALQHKYFHILENAASPHAVDYSRERVGGSMSRTSAQERAMVDAFDVLQEYGRALIRECNTRLAAMDLIFRVEDPVLLDALYYRYMTSLTAAQIAQKMEVSEKQIYRYIRAGLEALSASLQASQA